MTSSIAGVLVIDKPDGWSSHDVVAKVRRRLGTKRVGHAGTLDPMATGVLVVLLGEATKLAPFLSAHEKEYLATVAFGRETTTLDREGDTTEEREVPAWLLEELDALARGGRVSAGGRLEEALDAEKRRTEQIPPNVSAIHVDGARSYDRARRGETFVLEPRPVTLFALRATGACVQPPELSLELSVSKGFYVRSLARDLGVGLGTAAHLSALRRTRSGPFALADAVPLDADLGPKLIPLATAARRALPTAELHDEGLTRARQGKLLRAADFLAPPPPGGAAVWMSSEGAPIAVGEPSEAGTFRVIRGFSG